MSREEEEQDEKRVQVLVEHEAEDLEEKQQREERDCRSCQVKMIEIHELSPSPTHTYIHTQDIQKSFILKKDSGKYWYIVGITLDITYTRWSATNITQLGSN